MDDSISFVDEYLPEIRKVLTRGVADELIENPVSVVAGERIRVVLDGPEGSQAILVYYDDQDEWVRVIGAIVDAAKVEVDPALLLRPGSLPPPLRYCLSNGWYAVRADAVRMAVLPDHFAITFETFVRALPFIHAEWQARLKT